MILFDALSIGTHITHGRFFGQKAILKTPLRQKVVLGAIQEAREEAIICFCQQHCSLAQTNLETLRNRRI